MENLRIVNNNNYVEHIDNGYTLQRFSTIDNCRGLSRGCRLCHSFIKRRANLNQLKQVKLSIQTLTELHGKIRNLSFNLVMQRKTLTSLSLSIGNINDKAKAIINDY